MKEECARKKHICHEGETMCTRCSLSVQSRFDVQARKSNTWCQYYHRLNWGSLICPIGGENDFSHFSANNPSICLSVYQMPISTGDVFLHYRSPAPPEGVTPAMAHIVQCSRMNFEQYELESHFVAVNNLANFCAKVLHYVREGKSSSSYLSGNACMTCLRLFQWDRKKPIRKQIINTERAFLAGKLGSATTKYLVRWRMCN